MTTTKLKAAVLCVALAGVAHAALAFTWQELSTKAADLEETLGTIDQAAGACTDGLCSLRLQIEAAYEDAEDERLQLVADRQSLGSCSECGALDARIAACASLSGAILATITEWDDVS